jgi:hypothetical protein
LDAEARAPIESGTAMPFSDYTLDNFVAHKLSSLTECGAPELVEDANWLNPSILNAVLGLSREPKSRAYVSNFLRRTEGAFSTYREARSQLLQYVNGRRHEVISPYFRSLLNFEFCVSQWCEGFNLLRTATSENYFERNDGSREERIHSLYNSSSKHMDDRIAKGEIPASATATIWITNQGLEGTNEGGNEVALSFDELRILLLDMGQIAKRLAGG